VNESLRTLLHVVVNGPPFRSLDRSPTPGEGETDVPTVVGPLPKARVSPGVATSTDLQLRLKIAELSDDLL